ncbi:MAG: phospholipase A [Rhodocyclaceae bacterium]
MKRLNWLLLFLVCGPVAAQGEWILASDQTRIVAGGDFSVTVVRSGAGAAEAMPDSVVAKLSGDGAIVELRLTAVKPRPGERPAAAGRGEYQAQLPAATEGLVTLELSDRPSTKLLLLAEKALLEKPAASDALARMTGSTPAATKEASPVRAPALTSYEPMYFLVGTREGTSARFQLSFKYRLFDDEGVAVGLLPFLSGLHVAYTQTSLWDLASRSKPFRDNSYRPSAFYEWQGGAPVGDHTGWNVRTGVEHESNGRDGGNSRSINIAFVRPELRFHLGESWYGAVAPKIYSYLDKTDNADISRYRGHVDLGLTLGQSDGWQIASTIRRGKSGYGSAQVDVSYPFRKPFFADTGGFLHFQYFNGYGETILDYDVRHSPQFRVGVSIVR